jgi:hypothetical protein
VSLEKNLLANSQELNKFYRESFIDGVDIASSIWEESSKAIEKQMNWWTTIDKDYTKTLDEFCGKIAEEIEEMANYNLWWDGDLKKFYKSLTQYRDTSKGYFNHLKILSDILAKEQFKMAWKNAEVGFSILEKYLNLIND